MEKAVQRQETLRLGVKSSRGEVPRRSPTGREASAMSRGEVPATQSSLRSGSRSDHAEVRIVGVNNAVYKVLETRRGTGTGVQTAA